MNNGLLGNTEGGRFSLVKLPHRFVRCGGILRSVLRSLFDLPDLRGVCSVALFVLAFVLCSCTDNEFSDDSTVSEEKTTLGGQITLLVSPDSLTDAVGLEVTLSGYKKGAAEDYCTFYTNSSGSAVLAESPFGSPPENGTWGISADDELWEAVSSGGLYYKIDGTAGSLSYAIQDSSFSILTLDETPYVLVEPGEASDFEWITLTLSGYQNTEDEDGWFSLYYDENGSDDCVVSENPFGSPPENGKWTLKEDDDEWQKITEGGLWYAGTGDAARVSIEAERKESSELDDEAWEELASSVSDGCTLVVPSQVQNSELSRVASLLQGYSGVTVDLSETSITMLKSTLLNTGFKGCEALAAVILPETLEEIGDEAFAGCMNLESVEIPDTVERIGGYAFYNCRSLESFAVGESLEQIGEFAFADCTALKKVSLGDKVGSVGDSAFRNTSFTEVSLPKTLKTIGERAFSGNSLTTVEIPKGVEEIGEYAFYSCTKLERVTVSSSAVGSAQFFGCTKLSRVVLGEGVEVIGDHAFYGCNSLQSVSLPRTLKTIEAAAFSNCESLRSLEIPAGVIKIEATAFFRCASLREKKVVFAVTEGWLFGPDFKSTSDASSLAPKLLNGLALKRDDPDGDTEEQDTEEQDGGSKDDGLVVISDGE